MNKQEIIEFYKHYKGQVLLEMQEYFDQPLKDVKKINKNEYLASEGDLEIKFNFTRRFEGDLINLPDSVDKNQIKEYYELSWSFKNGNKNKQNFLRACGTSLSIISDFLKNNNNIKIISFSGLTQGHDSVYSGSFKQKIENLFGDEYQYIIKDNDGTKSYWLINKTILEINLGNGSIKKRSNETSLLESIIYWKYPNFHPETPPNVKTRYKIKQRVIQNLYIKEIK